MRIKKMQHKDDLLQQQVLKNIQDAKRKKLHRTLCLIATLAKVIQIGYYDAVKGTQFRNPKIKAKSDLLFRHTEDILKSLGDSAKMKDEAVEYMEYEHFTELYENLLFTAFVDTETIRHITKILSGEMRDYTEEEFKELLDNKSKTS